MVVDDLPTRMVIEEVRLRLGAIRHPSPVLLCDDRNNEERQDIDECDHGDGCHLVSLLTTPNSLGPVSCVVTKSPPAHDLLKPIEFIYLLRSSSRRYAIEKMLRRVLVDVQMECESAYGIDGEKRYALTCQEGTTRTG